MTKIVKYLASVVLLFMSIGVFAQEATIGYNPFVSANLDDVGKVIEAPVVESSYHVYKVAGDENFGNVSTFVWYVENGALGTYDPATDNWSSASTNTLGTGETLELDGENLDGIGNSSDIWVKWDDNTAGGTGYITVYERSADSCVFIDQITGFKHLFLLPPEVWFLAGTREECADQFYSITAQFNETNSVSFPYTLTYTYPGADGVDIEQDTIFNETDLSASNQLTWDLLGVEDLDVTQDETYVIRLNELRDSYGSLGKIAPLGISSSQFDEITITINHLPQTGGMIMDAP